MRSRRMITLLAAALFVVATLAFLRSGASTGMLRSTPPIAQSGPQPTPQSNPQPTPQSAPVAQEPATTSDRLLAQKEHPIEKLVDTAQSELKAKLEKQSQTLKQAVAEYRRRYRVHPPPNFDKWFAFAQKKGATLIDEFDTVYDQVLPFWSVNPAMLRARAREALGMEQNKLMRLSIRGGSVVSVEHAEEWQQKTTMEMMDGFVQYLPDMDLAFNIQDESRVVLPHDDLERLVRNALEKELPRALANTAPKNQWTPPPSGEMGDGLTFPEARTTRFNVFAHQPTWTHSRQSCSPDSPARALYETGTDDLAAWAASTGGESSSVDVHFVRNRTAFTDICNSPSLQERFGFFDRPNAYNVVHDLFPIFSQSKVSSYQDMVYPSPWYWADKVHYDTTQDFEWADKESKLWWRGSTTGGFSRNGGWRRQHRQRIVAAVNSGESDTTVLQNVVLDGQQRWRIATAKKSTLRHLFDVLFSYVGQCDEGDCEAQRHTFEIAPQAKQEDAWHFRYLLDVDGNAFSGRFYAFLRSHSLPFKMAVFREWHDEWIHPWVHYVPLSLEADEYYEAVRYFDQETRGREQAVQLAEDGRVWADKTLRNSDMEVWFFRLLLEYGRLVDDNRDQLGFSL